MRTCSGAEMKARTQVRCDSAAAKCEFGSAMAGMVNEAVWESIEGMGASGRAS